MPSSTNIWQCSSNQLLQGKGLLILRCWDPLMWDLASAIGSIGKLNKHNYKNWRSRLQSYLQGEDLWEIVGGNETEPPPNEDVDALKSWRIKAGQAMFAIKITIPDEYLVRIEDDDTPKMAWDTLAALCTPRNDLLLQLLENELNPITQGDMTIGQYFMRVKYLCREISELDPEFKIGKGRMRRMVIRGLRPEYNGIIKMIHSWPAQPSLVELESLLENQEILARQMGRVSMKDKDGGRRKVAAGLKKEEKPRSKWRQVRAGRAQGGQDNDEWWSSVSRRRNGGCYNCGKEGHYARNCWLRKCQ